MSKYPFKTMIAFKGEDLAEVERLCFEISQKDSTFRYKIERIVDKFKDKADNVLIIRSKTREQGHARGLLFCKRYLPELNLLYWVRGEAHGTKNHQDQLR